MSRVGRGGGPITMLQIGSGRLFSRETGRQNALRGILHTNLRLYGDRPIETAAGDLVATSLLRDNSVLIYEMTEHIEGAVEGPGVLVSRGMDSYQQEFATILAFALNVTCTPHADLLRRLTGDGMAMNERPSRFVRRVFDDDVTCREEDAAQLIAFVSELMRLERRSYRAAVRAIRTYVTGLHRLGDDLDLAYTLLVASIESLAQGFDGHRAVWADYDETKRRDIDLALAGASADTSAKVRQALLDSEHVSLARRFRDFTLDHVGPAYFRDDAHGQVGPIGRADLPEALQQAYRLRSRHLHNLEELPRLLTMGDRYNETIRIDRVTTLTFQGLSRLARHVIFAFIQRQPKVDREPYDYGLEQSGVVQVALSPEYWVGQVSGLSAQAGRGRLEGFLEQLSGHFLQPGSTITDLRDVLAKVEDMLPSLTGRQRLPFVALYLLFNRVAPVDRRMNRFEEVWQTYGDDLDAPSAESLFTHLLTGTTAEWSLPDHDRAHADYFRRRDRKHGLRAPTLFETGVTLELAERHRRADDLPRARQLISFAVENWPAHGGLTALEREFDGAAPISWEALLLPALQLKDGTAPEASA